MQSQPSPARHQSLLHHLRLMKARRRSAACCLALPHGHDATPDGGVGGPEMRWAGGLRRRSMSLTRIQSPSFGFVRKPERVHGAWVGCKPHTHSWTCVAAIRESTNLPSIASRSRRYFSVMMRRNSGSAHGWLSDWMFLIASTMSLENSPGSGGMGGPSYAREGGGNGGFWKSPSRLEADSDGRSAEIECAMG
jgi:hypothetical protein